MVTHPSRRLFRYSLRTLLVLVTVSAAFFGWLAWQWRIVQRRDAALTEIMSIGANITIGSYAQDRNLPLCRRWMGDVSVEQIILTEADIKRIGPPEMDNIQELLPLASL